MRAVFSYLGLVGLPFLALIGILRLGDGLKPPRAAHGHYAVTFDSSGSGRCIYELRQNGEQRLTVAQSGPRLELALGHLPMKGVVAGDSVRAHALLREAIPSRRASCLTADSLVLLAALHKTADTLRLLGEFHLPGCAACTPVPFRAVRQSQRQGAGGS